jgi:ethanolamine ammonia-lyase small subunit
MQQSKCRDAVVDLMVSVSEVCGASCACILVFERMCVGVCAQVERHLPWESDVGI